MGRAGRLITCRSMPHDVHKNLRKSSWSHPKVELRSFIVHPNKYFVRSIIPGKEQKRMTQRRRTYTYVVPRLGLANPIVNMGVLHQVNCSIPFFHHPGRFRVPISTAHMVGDDRKQAMCSTQDGGEASTVGELGTAKSCTLSRMAKNLATCDGQGNSNRWGSSAFSTRYSHSIG